MRKLLPTKNASDYLWDEHEIVRSEKSLAMDRVKKRGPVYIKVGGHRVVYDTDDLDAYAEKILHENRVIPEHGPMAESA